MTASHCAFGLTDRGLARDQNEDWWASEDALGVYVVADGVGDIGGGATAAKAVANGLPALLKARHTLTRPLPLAEATGVFRTAIRDLHRRVREAVPESELPGPQAAFVATWISDGCPIIAHAGDCRAYLLRAGRMIRLTRDHSLVQALVDSGELDPAAARTSPLRNQITRAINMPGDPAPDVRIESLEPGDRLLLCTDGVTTMLEDDAIREILSHSADASEVCRSLVQAANDAGGLDNITALVIDYRRPAPVRG